MESSFFDFLIYFRRRYIQWKCNAGPTHGHWFVIKQTLLSIEAPTSSVLSAPRQRVLGLGNDALERSTRTFDENAATSNQHEGVEEEGEEIDGLEIWERDSKGDIDCNLTKLDSIYLQDEAAFPAKPAPDDTHLGCNMV